MAGAFISLFQIQGLHTQGEQGGIFKSAKAHGISGRYSTYHNLRKVLQDSRTRELILFHVVSDGYLDVAL